MNRHRLAAALVLTLGAALDAQADVVTKSSVTTIAGGKTTEGEWVESVQGLRMRGHWASPKAPGCRSVGLIHDVAGNRVVILRCDKQEAEVVDAVKASAEVEKRLPARLVTTTIEPTGRSQEMLRVRCEEFAFSVMAPLNENIMLIRRGTAWVAKSGPGVEEYVAFYRSALTVITAGSIRAPKAVVAEDRTNMELSRQLALLGGVPYEMHITLEVQGRGIYASLMRKALEFDQSIKVTSIENGPLDSHVFDVPEGWKTRTR